LPAPPGPGAAVRLPLVGGGFTLVDPDVAARLRGTPLYRTGLRYVIVYESTPAGLRVHLVHQIVLRAPPGLVVHHVNADPCDNRRTNLRILTHSAHRLLEPARRSRLGWLGLWASHGFFYPRISVEGRDHLGPGFGSLCLAALARDDLAVRLTGGQVALNFPRRLRAARLRGWLQRQRNDFRVVFVPRGGGPLRDMHARRPLPLEEAARPPRPDLRAQRLVSVIDVAIDEYRFIPLEGVLCVQANATWWRIDRPRRARRRRGSTASATSSVPSAP
jgi:hypothetical protein